MIRNNTARLLPGAVKGNDFEFNGEMYHQVCDCVMGKRFGQNFASIYVAEWEEAALSKSSKSPATYIRYLDDLFDHTLKRNSGISLKY